VAVLVHLLLHRAIVACRCRRERSVCCIDGFVAMATQGVDSLATDRERGHPTQWQSFSHRCSRNDNTFRNGTVTWQPLLLRDVQEEQVATLELRNHDHCFELAPPTLVFRELGVITPIQPLQSSNAKRLSQPRKTGDQKDTTIILFEVHDSQLVPSTVGDQGNCSREKADAERGVESRARASLFHLGRLCWIGTLSW